MLCHYTDKMIANTHVYREEIRKERDHVYETTMNKMEEQAHVYETTIDVGEDEHVYDDVVCSTRGGQEIIVPVRLSKSAKCQQVSPTVTHTAPTKSYVKESQDETIKVAQLRQHNARANMGETQVKTVTSFRRPSSPPKSSKRKPEMLPPKPAAMVPPKPAAMAPPKPAAMVPPKPAAMVPPKPAAMLPPKPAMVPPKAAMAPSKPPMVPSMLPPKPAAKPMLPPKPVSHVTPPTSGSEGVYMPLRMTRSRQQEEDHYMPLCDATRERSHFSS